MTDNGKPQGIASATPAGQTERSGAAEERLTKRGIPDRRMNTLDLTAAASFLGLHRETLRERAAAGIIPGAKIGKEWRFLPDDLTAYFKSQCRSIAVREAPSGGSTSAILAADELDVLLANAKKRMRKEPTTSLRLVSGKSGKPAGSSRTHSRHGSKRKNAAEAT